MMAKPQEEHRWLDQLVGDWIAESECSMGPDQPPMKTEWTETTCSLHGMWVVSEGVGKMPDGSGPTSTVFQFGYDPVRGKYVGTFIGSMMTNLWLYEGSLDPAGQVLTLDTVGPSFTDPAKSTRYQDIIEIVDADHRILRSQALGDDGAWHPFMTAHYRRRT